MKKKSFLLYTIAFLVLGVSLSSCGNDTPATDQQEDVVLSGDQEIDQVTQRLQQDPENADLYALRAEIYYEKNSYDQAISDMIAAMSLDSANIDYHHLLTDIYLDYFRSRLALQTMERAVALAPEDIESWLKLAEIQIFLKMNQASMASIDKALRLDPQNALAYFFMGKNFEETGDINRAINAYQESSELDPEMLDTWIKLGQLHASIDGELAEAFFDNAIEVDSMNTIALSAKAEYLWDQDNPHAALELYQKAIRKDPMDEKGYFNAGLVLMELDSVQRAYEHFNMAVENGPLYAAAYYYRGLAAETLGDDAEALKDYEHTLRLYPDNVQAQQGVARLKKE